MEALELLASFVDQSDPDAAFANSLHAYQTAEEIRAAHPDDDWLHLTGLIHDLGKVMDHFDQPQVRACLAPTVPNNHLYLFLSPG